jgi:hypothetical protein
VENLKVPHSVCTLLALLTVIRVDRLIRGKQFNLFGLTFRDERKKKFCNKYSWSSLDNEEICSMIESFLSDSFSAQEVHCSNLNKALAKMTSKNEMLKQNDVSLKELAKKLVSMLLSVFLPH